MLLLGWIVAFYAVFFAWFTILCRIAVAIDPPVTARPAYPNVVFINDVALRTCAATAHDRC